MYLSINIETGLVTIGYFLIMKTYQSLVNITAGSSPDGSKLQKIIR